jgi:hypothetical protein
VTDFDILARIRKLELEVSRLKDRVADMGRMPPNLGTDPIPKPIWPVEEITDHEALGCMLHTMKRQGD